MSSTVSLQRSSPVSSSMAPSPPPVGTVPQNDMRDCSTCKRVQIPADHRWKTCASCREKSRKSRQKVSAARVALANMAIPNTITATPSGPGKRKEREDDPEDMSERLDRMKKRLRKMFKDKPAATFESDLVPVLDESRSSSDIEYRTATDMYQALKNSGRSSSMIQFRGTFSIVAVRKIDHERRERLVVEELRKIAKWSFEHDNPTLMSKGSGGTTPTRIKSLSVSYSCTCRKSMSVQAPSTRPNSLLTALATGTIPAAAPLKPRQSDLTAWVGKKSSPSNSSAGVAASTECKGKIRIYVEEDTSHPVVGIMGQKITVSIAH